MRLRNLWNRFLHIGSVESMTPYQKQQARVINTTAFVVIVICGLLIISTALQKRWEPFSVQVFRVSFALVAIYLNSQLFRQAALLTLFFSMTASIIAFMLYVPQQTGNAITFLIVFIYIFYFSHKNKTATILYWATAILFIPVYYYEMNYLPNTFPPVHLISGITFSTAIYFLLMLYRKNQRQLEKDLAESNRVIQLQKSDLQKRQEEIHQQNEELLLQTEHLEASNKKLEETQATLRHALAKEKLQKEEIRHAHQKLQQTKDQLIQSEKMAALGQLIANVAHELNTPLAAIQSNASSISDKLKYLSASLPKLYDKLSTDNQLVFDQFVAEASHFQITNNTLAQRTIRKSLEEYLFKHHIENAKPIARRLVKMGHKHQSIDKYFPLLNLPNNKEVIEAAGQLADLLRNAEIINIAVDRSTKVIEALRSHSYKHAKNELTEYNLAQGIDTALILHQNQLKRGIDIVKNYQNIPPILAYPDELGQVWINLIKNAIQAMGEKGNLNISVSSQNNEVCVTIKDSGKGIPEEKITQIFEPFFTTKPVGKGTGLGLNIVKGIINKHHGRIEVNSVEGKGTTFCIWLPTGKEKAPIKKATSKRV